MQRWDSSCLAVILARHCSSNAIGVLPLPRLGNAMTVERATLLIVGAVVLLTVLLAVYHSPTWLWVTGILGAHLIQASFTGMCPVVMTLRRMGLPSREGFA
jgi:hypothetical protein